MILRKSSWLRLVTILELGFACLLVLGGCGSGESKEVAAPAGKSTAHGAYQPAGPEIAEYRAKHLPMMLDFGKGWCKPCKAMAPDLEALHEELAGKVLVRFNNLETEEELAAQYRIRLMPTQVYLDGEGREVYRHEGYASKADILSDLERLGFLAGHEIGGDTQ